MVERKHLAAVTGRSDVPAAEAVEPLRVRRKRELRQHISDVATRMFFEAGFDAVRVADVARVAGVTEKTVFNHFPTKESLLADRWEARIADARRAMADARVEPVDAMQALVQQELELLMAPPWATMFGSHLADMQRYSGLMLETPALRMHEREQMNVLTDAVADALQERGERAAAVGGDAERWITAVAVVGLWSVFYRSLHGAVQQQQSEDLTELHRSVSGDIAAAAELLRRGLAEPIRGHRSR